MIGIIDYGVGNLRSVQKALEVLGHKNIISYDIGELANCRGLILPGVGAFPDAMKNLSSRGLDMFLKSSALEGRPILGICLGMQLLFDVSYEVTECRGLGLIAGKIVKLPEEVKIPHMGWNNLHLAGECAILEGLYDKSYVYFVHSYYADLENEEDLKAWTYYGGKVPAVVNKGNVFGAQFHPEKSGDIGMNILKNFGELII